MQQKLLMELEAKDYLLRYKQHLDEQAEKDPVVTLEKSRRVEALILRIQSKTERAIQQLKVFLDILDDVEN